MDKRVIIALVGALAFSITLGIVVGTRLVGQAVAIALGAAVGVTVGVVVGVTAALVILRMGRFRDGVYPVWDGLEPGETPTVIALTPEQADVLLRALQRQQASPEAFSMPVGRSREFSAVGGASLPDDET